MYPAEKIRQVRELLAQNVSQSRTAAMTGLSESTVYRIAHESEEQDTRARRAEELEPAFLDGRELEAAQVTLWAEHGTSDVCGHCGLGPVVATDKCHCKCCKCNRETSIAPSLSEIRRRCTAVRAEFRAKPSLHMDRFRFGWK